MKRQDLARWLVCALSVALLVVVGQLGELMLNQGWVRRLASGDTAAPTITSFLLANYGLNAGGFTWSLTPFMLGMLCMALFFGRGEGSDSLFWYGFVSLWLLVLVYCGLFVLTLGAPYIILMWSPPAAKTIRNIVMGINLVLIAAIILQITLRCGKLWKAHRREDQS